MYLLNGESKHCIDISDRGFQYGDGVFETIEISNGTPVFIEQHLLRLVKGCKKLLIPAPDVSILRKEAIQLSRQSSTAVLKLMITRGSGGRGYRQPMSIQPTRLLYLSPFPDHPAHFWQQGITARFCESRLGLNPSLAGIKHMNRLEQIIARAEWSSPDIHEGLMLDSNNNVIEGTMSNLFLVKNNTLYTPEIQQSGVEGIIRNILISLAKEKQISVFEKKIDKQEVTSADELFISNSIIGIWPIKKIADQQYKVGLLTQKLQSLFLALKKQELDNVC